MHDDGSSLSTGYVLQSERLVIHFLHRSDPDQKRWCLWACGLQAHTAYTMLVSLQG